MLFSVGVRPELGLARSAGLEIGASGGLLVDEHLRTSDPDIYAAGDMVEVVHKVSGRRVRIPLAGPANRQGRIAASNALGVPMRYSGALGTSVVKVFEATAAMTGLSERAAREAGFDVGVVVIHKDHHAGYYPGAKELSLKLVYDRRTARLLGAQAFGHGGVDKRIDVLATALQGEMTLHELAELDLAYAPPYSSANDPVNVAAFAGLNDLSGFAPLVTAAQLQAELESGERPLVLDVRSDEEFARSHVRGAKHVPLDALRESCDALPRDRRIVVDLPLGLSRPPRRPDPEGARLRRRRERDRWPAQHGRRRRLRAGGSVNLEPWVVAAGAAATFVFLRRVLGGNRVSSNVVLEKIRAGAVIVDVRTPTEFSGGAYPAAINIPLHALGGRLGEIPKGRPVVVYCASGIRSATAARVLRQAGYDDVVNAGGLHHMVR